MTDLHSSPLSAEDAFRKGEAALKRRAYMEAAAHFQTASQLDSAGGTKKPRLRYASFLGLALTLAYGRSEAALKLCEQAVRREFFDPDMFCNLGIVYLRNRRREAAFRMFQQGLKLRPSHRRIWQEISRCGNRRRPFFGFLPRRHSVNRVAGRFCARVLTLIARAAPAGP